MTMPQHDRRSFRLKDYDYAATGAYFVTICTQNRASLFGEVMGDAMQLSEYGDIVARCWEEIPAHCKNVELDAFVVMPNHVHGIIVLTVGLPTAPVVPAVPVGAQHAAPIPEPLDLRSLDIAEEKRQELLRLFPEARTEGGKITLSG